MGVLAKLFGGGDKAAVPPPIPPPPPAANPPSIADSTVAATIASARGRAAGAEGSGFGGTVATSSQGASKPETAMTSLLGG